ncbi:MAG: hypothetical protein J6B39_07475 [Lachnospiraceae bacterium]|nr:hypothetical protein [Lachnospiraceae bacterium]
MKNIVKTLMLKKYLVKFAIRIVIFIFMAVMYIKDKALMYDLMTPPVWMGITPVHVLWLVFMVMMLLHIFPPKEVTMALRKADKEKYEEQKDYSELELLKYVQDQNVKAWKVMLVWLSFNAVFGILYLFKIIDNADLLMLTVFYFLSDYICILLFCPFQTGIMKNRCCVNCRIYDWGHFMMFTPMLFIKNFFSWSLFFTSCVVLIKWEIIYAKHPERFWNGSNKALKCANCKDKTCQIKNALKKK